MLDEHTAQAVAPRPLGPYAWGKCVSAMAKARRQGTILQAQDAIVNAAKACKAEGLRKARLGACVSARDGLAATPADPANRGKKRDDDD